ncbi:MAG: pilus assembly protein CpaD [Rhizobiales bacterium]|nr:pilus assembly protein CpaD [Hyphomicrobiales bacterium]
MSPFVSIRQSRNLRATASVLAISLVALGVAGCKPEYKPDTYVLGYTVPDPAMKHPIIVTDAPVFLEVDVARGSSGLTPAQLAEVRGFLSGYRAEGRGGLTISAPSGSLNETSGMYAAGEIKRLAQQTGIDASAIYMEPYGAPNHPGAPVKISFIQTVAKAPECGRWPGNLGETSRNEHYHNYGCAQQRNLAAMVANPRDLLGPRTMDPRPGERGYTQWGKWIAGQPTGAERSEDEKSGNISEVASN